MKENPDFFTALLGSFAAAPNSLRNLASAAQAFSKPIAEEMNDNGTKGEGYQSALTKLSNNHTLFKRAEVWAVSQSLLAGRPPEGTSPSITAARKLQSKGHISGKAGVPVTETKKTERKVGMSGSETAPAPSLPHELDHILIGEVLPGQEIFLSNFAGVLAVMNNGAEIGNVLMSDMTDPVDFSDADHIFDFRSWLIDAGNGNFKGSEADAKQQLDEEKSCRQCH